MMGWWLQAILVRHADLSQKICAVVCVCACNECLREDKRFFASECERTLFLPGNEIIVQPVVIVIHSIILTILD